MKWRVSVGRISVNEYRVSVKENEKVLEMDGSNGCIIMYMVLMPSNCIFKNG